MITKKDSSVGRYRLHAGRSGEALELVSLVGLVDGPAGRTELVLRMSSGDEVQIPVSAEVVPQLEAVLSRQRGTNVVEEVSQGLGRALEGLLGFGLKKAAEHVAKKVA